VRRPNGTSLRWSTTSDLTTEVSGFAEEILPDSPLDKCRFHIIFVLCMHIAYIACSPSPFWRGAGGRGDLLINLRRFNSFFLISKNRSFQFYGKHIHESLYALLGSQYAAYSGHLCSFENEMLLFCAAINKRIAQRKKMCQYAAYTDKLSVFTTRLFSLYAAYTAF
jgi:hypothetical protein